jgi:hypothetical protein
MKDSGGVPSRVIKLHQLCFTEKDLSMSAHVIAVARDTTHRFSKTIVPEIRLLQGLGVEGDAHCGETVKHRSRVRTDPTQQNLRQVHLYQSELFDEYAEKGFTVPAGVSTRLDFVPSA